ncbi:MAG TPA: DUF1097 domain-containing protein [Methylophilaceae bacterium]|nr:DUF1097 domain-containing protein [Methylophilaceae bacterium]
MNKLNAATLVAVVMTALVLYVLAWIPAIPVWAVFISWACFFHMNGGESRNQAWLSTLLHIGVGIVSAWLSALVVLSNPLAHASVGAWWAPVIIGLVIGVLFRLGVSARFSITPAIIYGYAGTFAFLSVPGRFSKESLMSLSLDNVLLAMGISLALGISAGYVNAIVVERLCMVRLKGSKA